MLKKISFRQDAYLNGHFTPWLNYLHCCATQLKSMRNLSFTEMLILTSDQQRVMRDTFGGADFQFDGEFRNYVWAFQYEKWTLLYFCSKKGGSLEIEHQDKLSPFGDTISKPDKVSLGKALTTFKAALSSWLTYAPLTPDTYLIREGKELEKLAVQLKPALTLYNDTLSFSSKEDALQAGFRVVSLSTP